MLPAGPAPARTDVRPPGQAAQPEHFLQGGAAQVCIHQGHLLAGLGEGMARLAAVRLLPSSGAALVTARLRRGRSSPANCRFVRRIRYASAAGDWGARRVMSLASKLAFTAHPPDPLIAAVAP